MKKIENELICHDCKKKTAKGFDLVYKDGGEKIKIFKCQSCFQKNPSLTSFRKCEVYSRVVGYLRPVDQWHKGKKQEFKERKVFKES
jgi:anaerobic ribonucleoside-triphosphate reductase